MLLASSKYCYNLFSNNVNLSSLYLIIVTLQFCPRAFKVNKYNEEMLRSNYIFFYKTHLMHKSCTDLPRELQDRNQLCLQEQYFKKDHLVSASMKR